MMKKSELTLNLKRIEKYYKIANEVNSINRIDLVKLEKSKIGYYDEVDELLMPIYLDSDKAMLDEFRYRLITSDIYPLGCTRDLLSILTHNKVDTNTSIEHIRPQDIKAKDWDKENYYPMVNNLGNLTLTNKNSILSNKSFEDKKEIYKSEFQDLNFDVIDKNTWNLDMVRTRANRMAHEIILDLFPMDLLKKEMFIQKSYFVNIFGLPDKHYKINYVIYEDKILPINRMEDLYIFVVREVYKKNKDKLFNLALEDNNRFTTDPIKFAICEDINYEVFYRLDLNKYQFLSAIRYLVDEFDLKFILNIERK